MGAVTQTRWPVGNRQAHDFALEVRVVTREGQATPETPSVVALRGDYLTTVIESVTGSRSFESRSVRHNSTYPMQSRLPTASALSSLSPSP